MSDYETVHWATTSASPRPERIPPAYTRVALHDDVPVATLTRALTRFGLTLSNVQGVGLVIHRADQEPT
jgi:hypothetical protein